MFEWLFGSQEPPQTTSQEVKSNESQTVSTHTESELAFAWQVHKKLEKALRRNKSEGDCRASEKRRHQELFLTTLKHYYNMEDPPQSAATPKEKTQ